MKSLLLSAFSVFLFSSAFAQLAERSFTDQKLPLGYNVNLRMSDKSRYFDPELKGRGLSFMYSEFGAAEKLNSYLDATGSARKGAFDAYYMGIGLDGIATAEGNFFDAISSLSFILPQKVFAGANDSAEFRLGGWHATSSALGIDLIKGGTVTLAIGPAWSYGNLKMRRVIAGQKTWYTNPFIAPGGRAEFRLIFGKFTIGARATYRYDITHSLWKRKDDMMPVLPVYKNSGLAYFGYIGIIF
jgi:hypothetical protein